MNAPSRRRLAVGGIVAAVYVVVAVATVAGTDRHVRPLFEGIGPAPPYRWVKPPPDFAGTNVKPARRHSDLPLGPAGSPPIADGTDDGQVVLNLLAGAIPPRAGTSGATLDITPLDPARLGAPPPGVDPDGNAYRIAITYRPAGESLDALAKAGNLLLVVPDAAEALLYSPDGRVWERTEARPVGSSTTIGAPLSRTGYYLGAAPPLPPAKGGGHGGGVVALVSGLTALLALALLGGPALRRRRRPSGLRR